jgi:putative transposase|tara:strand:+ start:146 stop:337 length:192 start_codon:yes stop_codon:yes gene_type:complete
MEEFVKYYNFQRYHESLENLTPSDVHFGNGQKKLKQRKLIKNRTLQAKKTVPKKSIKFVRVLS